MVLSTFLIQLRLKVSLRLHEQINRTLFEQTLTGINYTDYKIEQIYGILFAHVSKALCPVHALVSFCA